MLSRFKRWVDHRRDIRRQWQHDARALLSQDERGAYYAAQRLAARSRATGDSGAFLHWTKVAAEVARLSSMAEMDLATVQAVVDGELDAARPGQSTPP